MKHHKKGGASAKTKLKVHFNKTGRGRWMSTDGRWRLTDEDGHFKFAVEDMHNSGKVIGRAHGLSGAQNVVRVFLADEAGLKQTGPKPAAAPTVRISKSSAPNAPEPRETLFREVTPQEALRLLPEVVKRAPAPPPAPFPEPERDSPPPPLRDVFPIQRAETRRALFQLLKYCQGIADRDGAFQASLRSVSEGSGVNRNSARRYLRRMVEVGLLADVSVPELDAHKAAAYWFLTPIDNLLEQLGNAVYRREAASQLASEHDEHTHAGEAAVMAGQALAKLARLESVQRGVVKVNESMIQDIAELRLDLDRIMEYLRETFGAKL